MLVSSVRSAARTTARPWKPVLASTVGHAGARIVRQSTHTLFPKSVWPLLGPAEPVFVSVEVEAEVVETVCVVPTRVFGAGIVSNGRGSGVFSRALHTSAQTEPNEKPRDWGGWFQSKVDPNWLIAVASAFLSVVTAAGIIWLVKLTSDSNEEARKSNERARKSNERARKSNEHASEVYDRVLGYFAEMEKGAERIVEAHVVKANAAIARCLQHANNANLEYAIANYDSAKNEMELAIKAINDFQEELVTINKDATLRRAMESNMKHHPNKYFFFHPSNAHLLEAHLLYHHASTLLHEMDLSTDPTLTRDVEKAVLQAHDDLHRAAILLKTLDVYDEPKVFLDRTKVKHADAAYAGRTFRGNKTDILFQEYDDVTDALKDHAKDDGWQTTFFHARASNNHAWALFAADNADADERAWRLMQNTQTDIDGILDDIAISRTEGDEAALASLYKNSIVIDAAHLPHDDKKEKKTVRAKAQRVKIALRKRLTVRASLLFFATTTCQGDLRTALASLVADVELGKDTQTALAARRDASPFHTLNPAFLKSDGDWLEQVGAARVAVCIALALELYRGTEAKDQVRDLQDRLDTIIRETTERNPKALCRYDDFIHLYKWRRSRKFWLASETKERASTWPRAKRFQTIAETSDLSTFHGKTLQDGDIDLDRLAMFVGVLEDATRRTERK